MKFLKKIRMLFGIGLTPEEKEEMLQIAKEYSRKHTFQLPINAKELEGCPVICPKCKNKTALVDGTFYFDADEEPYESGERLELDLYGEKRISGHYCEQCNVMIEVWDDDALSKEFQKEVKP